MSSSKDKLQKQQEKFQAILSSLLREEDNKYCADCDSKGPRWASWNLGVFLCIRCAGIHRNLGVHISRVKSVNLDQWTPEQIASMQSMGNSRAKAIYESSLPDNYRRSTTDSAMEQFIRGKYEARKWIDKNWSPTPVTVPPELLEIDSEKKRTSDKPKIEIKMKTEPNSKPVSNGTKKAVETVAETVKKQEPKLEDVLFDFGSSDSNPPPSTTNLQIVNNSTNEMEDLFANINMNQNDFVFSNQTNEPIQPSINNNSNQSDMNLIGELMTTPMQTSNNSKIDKNSILALYGSKSTTPQMTPSNSLQQLKPQTFSNPNFQQNSSFPIGNQAQSNKSSVGQSSFNDLFSFDAFAKPTTTTTQSTVPNTLPNIGNTLSTDLWHM
ncbi:unnamed protein product [Brachionus calyciflorus]|uniref:Arf-GAP domain-containing protein n=1 Tax=Brachionus calyciflorus TaxID=104777 RepID=A0A814CLP6_9BILA|nr:unnamed protein product [Brachionus calyciflorus]